jgi:hypothetical protein
MGDKSPKNKEKKKKKQTNKKEKKQAKSVINSSVIPASNRWRWVTAKGVNHHGRKEKSSQSKAKGQRAAGAYSPPEASGSQGSLTSSWQLNNLRSMAEMELSVRK